MSIQIITEPKWLESFIYGIITGSAFLWLYSVIRLPFLLYRLFRK